MYAIKFCTTWGNNAINTIDAKIPELRDAIDYVESKYFGKLDASGKHKIEIIDPKGEIVALYKVTETCET